MWTGTPTCGSMRSDVAIARSGCAALLAPKLSWTNIAARSPENARSSSLLGTLCLGAALGPGDWWAARLSHAALSARFVRASAAMPAAVAAATVEGATVKAASVNGVTAKSAVEVVIVKSSIEISANKAAEADASVIGPTIAPVRIISGGIVVVVRYGDDTVCGWRRGSIGSGGSARRGRSAGSGSGRRHGRTRWTFFGRDGVRRWRGAGCSRRWARHRIVAVCRGSLRRATGKLCSNQRRAQS
jgi:hypothetical protein